VKTKVLMAAAAAAACTMAVSQAATATPSEKELTQAVQAFLAEHGDLCMAKYTWPRDLTPGSEDIDRNDELQLPVLEHLGLVHSVEIPAVAKEGTASPQGAQPAPTRRYSLTDKGQQYYLKKKHTVLGAHDAPTQYDADFCVAHLTLDKVVKWSPPEPAHNHLETVVRYTYRIKAADWMSDPDAQKVFPIVDRIIRGEGHKIMTATVALQNGKWVPVMPGQ
jgi:hypothetical protein